ncbi:MAG: agmatinase [Planctomycetota bacterium]
MGDREHFDYRTHPYGFGAIPRTIEQQNPSVCLIPVPYDSTSSSKQAARRGPEAILRASRNLELFDSELGIETFKVGIQTLGEVEPNVNSPFENSQVVEAVVTDVLQEGKLPVVIGGDHSLTVGAVRAALNKYPDMGFVMLDAHPDLFDKYEGAEYGHASVARRIHELGVTVAIAGVRSASRDEAGFIQDSGISLVTAREILRSRDSFEAILSALPERVYLSIDLDALDPGQMPAVANPEPGGLGWYDVVDCLDGLTRKKTVIGFDVVELCPIPGNPTPDFTAAKLIYRVIGLIFRENPASGGVEESKPGKARTRL